MRAFAPLLLSLSVAACGFHGLSTGDGGVDLASSDLAGADFSGSDLASAAGLGPGPLGALPTGFCCSSSDQCRARQCINLGSGPFYCGDPCTDTSVCAGWTTTYYCDTSVDTCVPTADPYTCTDGAQFMHGGKPTGACCDGASTMRGYDCLGGWCLQTGAQANPYYCSQGCNATTPCPSGYTCHQMGIGGNNPGRCEKSDPSYNCS